MNSQQLMEEIDRLTRLCESKDTEINQANSSMLEAWSCARLAEEKISEAQAQIAMQAKALELALEYGVYPQGTGIIHQIREALFATSETVAAWRAKETEPLRRVRWTTPIANPSDAGGFVAYGDYLEMKQKLAAAEARIKASQEQGPAGYLTIATKRFLTHDQAIDGHYSAEVLTPLYAAQVIPPDVAELQRDNAELTRKLAEQQAIMRLASLAFDKTASEFRSGYLSGGSVETSNLRVEAWRAVANCDSAELTKLLAEAKSKTVPEGCTVERGFEYNASTGLHTPTLTIFFPAVDSCCSDAWEERDSFAELLAAAPQPETDRCSNDRS